MRRAVLDSYAVVAFLFQEPGCDKVIDLLELAVEADQNVFIAAPNWAEVRYIVERKVGERQWREVRSKLLGLPLEVIPADLELAELAGEIKAAQKMSLADCFAAALAKRSRAQIYTGDPEFKAVEREIQVVWL